jgi:membrane-bound lytic murein transglycosylase
MKILAALSATMLVAAGTASACPMTGGQSVAIDRDTVVASIAAPVQTPIPAEERAAPVETVEEDAE